MKKNSLECEICGKKTDKLYKVEIEGSIAMVCEDCKVYGREIKEENKYSHKVSIRHKNTTTKYLNKHYKYEEPEEQIIENYASILRKAISNKYTVEELAHNLGIKESYMRKIINGELTPSLEEAKRMEKVLGITLIEKTPLPSEEIPSHKSENAKKEREKNEEKLTLGDILNEVLNKKNKHIR